MASPFAPRGASDGRSSPFAPAGGTAARPSPFSPRPSGGGLTGAPITPLVEAERDRGGILGALDDVSGFFENTGEGFYRQIVGIPAGLKTVGGALYEDVFEHPLRPVEKSATYRKVVKPIGEYGAYQYGPLVRGDWSTFGKRLYEDPSGPILDLFTVALGGAGLAGKVGGRLAEAGKIPAESRIARLGQPGKVTLTAPSGETLSRLTSPAPGSRWAAQLVDKTLKTLPPDMAMLGEFARYRREINKRGTFQNVGDIIKLKPFIRAESKLTRDERVATSILTQLPTPELVQGWRGVIQEELRAGNPNVQAGTLELLDSPKIMVLVENPTPNMVAALRASAELTEHQSVRLTGQKALHPVGAEARKWLPARVATGARFVTKGMVAAQATLIRRNWLYDRNQLASLDRYLERQMNQLPAERARIAAGDTKALERYERKVKSLEASREKLRALSYEYEDLLPDFAGVNEDLAGRTWGDVEMRDFGSTAEMEAYIRAQKSDPFEGGQRQPTLPRKQVDAEVARLTEEWQAERGLGEMELRNLVKEGKSTAAIERQLAEGDAALASKVAALQQRLPSDATRARARVERKFTETADEVFKLERRRDSLRARMEKIAAEAGDDSAMTLAALRKSEEGRAAAVADAHEALRIAEEQMTDRQAELRKAVAEGDVNLDDRLAELQVGLIGGTPIHELEQAITAAGRPLPSYFPHTVESPSKRGEMMPGFGRAPGTGVPVRPGELKRNEAVLFTAGMIVLDPSVVTESFLRTARYAHYLDLHAEMLRAARPVEELPKGWTFVRRPVGKPARSERIPYLDRFRGDFRRYLEELIPDADVGEDLDLFTPDRLLAQTDEQGRYLAIPRSMADGTLKTFGRSNTFTRYFIERPLTIWRALVLGLRVGYLVNNVVGNHMLYALRLAGVDGLRAYLHAIYNARGPEMVRRMLNMPGTPRGIRRQFMEELFPTQVEGTFFGTQLPGGQIGKWTQRASLGLIPTDRAIEAGLRRAATETFLRKHPKVREITYRMRDDAASFEDVARQAIRENPGLVREVDDRVNSVMGDYLSLSTTEKRVVRQIVPFWAWIRAITEITVRLPLETPLRTNLLGQLGKLGYAETQEAFEHPLTGEPGLLPRSMEGVIPLPGGRALRTGGFNPFATVPQAVSGARAILPSAKEQHRRDLLGQANPFLAALARTAASGGSKGLVGETVYGVGEQLPLTRLANPPDSPLYRGDDFHRQVLQYLGVPVFTPDPYEMARRARREGREGVRP